MPPNSIWSSLHSVASIPFMSACCFATVNWWLLNEFGDCWYLHVFSVIGLARVVMYSFSACLKASEYRHLTGLVKIGKMMTSMTFSYIFHGIFHGIFQFPSFSRSQLVAKTQLRTCPSSPTSTGSEVCTAAVVVVGFDKLQKAGENTRKIPWKSHGNPMEIPWKSHGNPMELINWTNIIFRVK